MLDVRVEEDVAVRRVAGALVERLRGELGRERRCAARAARGARASASTSSAAASPRPRCEGATAIRPSLTSESLGQQAAGADDLAVVDDDEVQRLVVAPVELLLEAHALLDAEDVVAQRQGGVDLGLVSRRPDLGHDAA